MTPLKVAAEGGRPTSTSEYKPRALSIHNAIIKNMVKKMLKSSRKASTSKASVSASRKALSVRGERVMGLIATQYTLLYA